MQLEDVAICRSDHAASGAGEGESSRDGNRMRVLHELMSRSQAGRGLAASVG